MARVGEIRAGIRARCATAAWLPALVLCTLLPVVCHGADKNGVAPNVVSLLDGPGSISGLGETFDPDLFTGTAKYAFGMGIPPGTAGFQPEVVPEYDGGSGNGPLGFGWSLGIPHIQRKTSKGVPRYVDGPNGLDDNGDGQVDEPTEVDRFITSDPENLVPQADGFYFAERESEFVRYRRVGDHWEGREPDGTLLEFGISDEARVMDAETGRVFLWNLERETDRNGNVIQYFYRRYAGDENLNQSYLARIEYGPGAPPWENKRIIAFRYESRPDWFESGRAGFLVRTGMRLAEVLMSTQGPVLEEQAEVDLDADGVSDYLSNRYEFLYHRDPHWSLLSEVIEYGGDGVEYSPPMLLDYTVVNTASVLDAAQVLILSENAPSQVMDSEHVELTDLNGDSLPDLLRTDPVGGLHWGYLNLGVFEADGRRVLRWGPRFTIGGDQRVWSVNLDEDSGVSAHLADMNADERSDLVYKFGGDVYYFPNEIREDGIAWGTRRRMDLAPGSPLPSMPYQSTDVEVADADGNQRPDIVQSIQVNNRAYYRVWHNLEVDRYAAPVTVPSDAGFLLSYEHMDLLDFNGDDLPDLTRITPDQVEVMPGLGYGRFGPIVYVDVPDYHFDDKQLDDVELTDITGDGLPDLVMDTGALDELWFFQNLGTYRLGDRRVITSSSYGEDSAVRWADMNGNGTTDVVYGDRRSGARLAFIDVGEMLGCVPSPNLLIRVENGIGSRTKIGYSSSESFRLADERAGRPWSDPLPMTIDVVADITTDDMLGNAQTTRLAYRDGYYHPERLEFTGFAEAEQIEVGDANVPTLVSRFLFDTGRNDYLMNGNLLSASHGTESGEVFWRETHTWENRILYTGVDAVKVSFPHKTRTLREAIELGNGDPVQTETEYEYDNYGNMTAEKSYGIVESGDRAAGEDERIARTEYANDLGPWLLRFPARTTVEDLSGTVISRKETYYDDPAFTGANFGVVLVGNSTMSRAWREPADPESHVTSERVHYDAYGNQVALYDPLAEVPGGVVNPEAGHYRLIEYDPRLHIYPVKETIFVGDGKEPLVVEAQYNIGLGTLEVATNFNGQQTRYIHDLFGFLYQTIEPGDSEEFASAEYDYGFADTFGDGLINWVETRLLDRTPAPDVDKTEQYHVVRRYIDGLGRLRMEKSEAEPDPDTGVPRVVVTAAARFNARGSVAAELLPFYTLDAPPGSALEDLMAYEDIGAVNWQGLFSAGDSLSALRLEDAPKMQTHYDATLREVRKVNADGTFQDRVYGPLTTHFYDENDTDPASPHFDTPTSRYLDGLGRLARTEERVRLFPDGTVSDEVQVYATRMEYRPDGALTRITDALGNEKWMEYDGLGRKIYANDINRGETHYAYDDADNLSETIDAKGQRITYTYDGVNRPLSEDYHDEGLPFSAEFAYDPGQPITEENRPDVVYLYDSIDASVDLGNGQSAVPQNSLGRLTGIFDLAGAEYSSFDLRGRVEWVVKQLPAMEGRPAASYQTRMTHDAQGRVIELVYPDEDRVEYQYNDRNLVERIVAGSREIVSNVDYLPTEQRALVGYGNGAISRYGYDLRGRLTHLTTGLPGATPLVDNEYDYDGVTNITRILDQRPADLAQDGDPRRNTQIFAYDGLYRLTQVDYSHTLPGTEIRQDTMVSFRHDPLGNLLAQHSDLVHEVGGVPLTDVGEFTYGGDLGTAGRVGRTTADPGPHAVTQIVNGESVREFSYDANGNMTEMDGLDLTWDFRDRLVGAENATHRASYVYDYTGRRMVKRVWDKSAAEGATPETVIYVGKHFEVREHGEATKYVFQGDTRIARATGHLDTDVPRLQRLALFAGWNLVAIAVQADDMAAQLGIDGSPMIEAAFMYVGGEERFAPVAAGTPLPAGTICWIRAADAVLIPILGAASAPAREDAAAQGFFAWTGPEALDTSHAIPEADSRVWSHDAFAQTWRTRIDGEPAVSDLPAFLAAGMAVHVASADPLVLDLPPETGQIHYYHQDHLGSSSVVADAEGNLVREIAYYPFGEARFELDTEAAEGVSVSPYRFMQKERDTETGLHYFKSRYLSGALARFNRVDPAVEDVPAAALSDPQLLHAYAFARNNPITFTDPEGQFPQLGKKESIAARLLDPFGDAKFSSDTSKAERRKAVFGELKFKKGEGLPEGKFIPPFWQDQVDGVKAGLKVGPNQLISSIAEVGSRLQLKYPDNGKKQNKQLDVNQLLNVILQKPDQSATAQMARLDKFFSLGGKVTAGGDLSESPITKGGKLVSESISKQIVALQDTLKSLDLKAKFKEFSDIAKKQEFKFDQAEVDKFIDKFILDDVEEKKKDEKEEEEDEKEEEE